MQTNAERIAREALGRVSPLDYIDEQTYGNAELWCAASAAYIALTRGQATADAWLASVRR